MDTNQAMQDFVNKLVDEKNYEDLDPEVREQIVKDVNERLENTINAKVVAALSDEQITEFEALLDKNASSEEVQAFIGKSIPNGEEFLTQVLVDFKKSYLGLV